jgi:hypothetical protein
MATLTTDQARELLGGPGRPNGHNLLAGHTDRNGMTLVTSRPRFAWGRPEARERGDGHRLIGAGALLLAVLGLGLLAVSIDAQYRYVLAYRHQSATSVIEATALDVGMLIFSLLALGLARRGLAAKTERALIVACAAGSALMNYAAADVNSPRSVLAYCMPPVFLAVVVDRVVATTRRHVLGMRDGRSPWSVAGTTAGRCGRAVGIIFLYLLRFLVAAPSTCTGVRRAILAATPLPEPAAAADDERQDDDQKPDRDRRERRGGDDRRRERRAGPSKKAILLDLYRQHEDYGDRALVSPVAAELAPRAGLQAGTARTYLYEHLDRRAA